MRVSFDESRQQQRSAAVLDRHAGMRGDVRPDRLDAAVGDRYRNPLTISQPDVQAIFIGMHSLDAPASVDDFKFLMGYAAKPVRQQVVFHPWLRPAINRYTYTMVKGLKSFRTGHPALRKAEGLIRFYLEGQRPLQEQTLPPVLQAAVMGQAT